MVIFYLLSAYLIGNFMTGYFVLKYFSGQDIRTIGSGNVGARNAGRSLGKKGFVLTLLGDLLKGVITILLAKWVGLTAEIQTLVLFAVVLGHIFPIFLRFKGGKGVAVFLGGLLIFDYKIILMLSVFFVVFYLIIRSFTLGGLITFLFIPTFMLLFQYAATEIFLMSVVILVVILAHWKNIRERLRGHS